MTRLVVVLLLAVGLSAGCSRNDVGTSGDQGFVAGKGVITTVAEHDRKAPGTVEGATLGGGRASLADLRGKVVVVNVWGSWCSPCRQEAPMLAQASRDLASKGVVFLGIDSRDPSEAAAQAFVRQMNIPYPSIYDQSGRTLLAFHGTLPPNSIPSTIVLDKQGRVASSVIGPVSRTTLDDLVDDAGAQAAS
jgi:thiol-disulfide isomerase/thioredoxin